MEPVGSEPAAVQRIFVATGRVMDDPLTADGRRAQALSWAVLDIGIPAGHEPGRIESAGGGASPSSGFGVVGAASLPDGAAFLDAVAREPAPRDADVVVYVHGYNTTYDEAVLRHAQMAHDFGTPGPHITFSWPSAAQPLGYVRDHDSIDIARDDLEDLLKDLAQGDRGIVLLGHSMGSQLVVETLRQMAIGGEEEALGRLSSVVLFSPDIDIDLFAAALGRVEPRPDPFVVVLSRRDRVLGLSARLTGRRERLGSTSDVEMLRSLGVTVIDVTGLSGRDRADGHLLAATSPTAITVIDGLERLPPETFEDGPTVLDFAGVLVTLAGPARR